MTFKLIQYGADKKPLERLIFYTESKDADVQLTEAIKFFNSVALRLGKDVILDATGVATKGSERFVVERHETIWDIDLTR